MDPERTKLIPKIDEVKVLDWANPKASVAEHPRELSHQNCQLDDDGKVQVAQCFRSRSFYVLWCFSLGQVDE